MPKKWTMADLQAWAAQHGGVCQSQTYNGMNAHHSWQCSEGHNWLASPSSVKSGHWCAQCYGNTARSMNELTQLALARGGVVLDEGKKDNRRRNHWQCERGHEWFALASAVARGSWCPVCAGSAKLSIDVAVAEAHKQGGTCLSEEYVNARAPLTWLCAEGHQWQATLGKIRSGQWCGICRRKAAADQLRLTMPEIQFRAAEKGGRCVSTSYGGKAGIPLEFECGLGHRWWASPNTIQRSWCPYCAGKIVTLDEVREVACARGGQVISNKYLGDNRKLTWQCALGHKWSATPGSIKRGSWCPQCSAGLGERLCRVAFEALFGEAFPSSFPEWLRFGGRLKWQLDGYCEPLSLAFEHHGVYHYKVDGIYSKDEKALAKRQSDDKKKVELCRLNNVTLIVVPEIPSMLPMDEVVSFIVRELKSVGISIPNPEAIPDWGKAYSPNDPVDMFQAMAVQKGGVLLSKHYIGAGTPLIWRCGNGHEWKANPNSIQQGSWCPYCVGSRVSEAEKQVRLKAMHEEAVRRGGRCSAESYQNGNSRVGWICSLGHEWQATPRNVMVNKSWCPTCYADSRRKRTT